MRRSTIYCCRGSFACRIFGVFWTNVNRYHRETSRVIRVGFCFEINRTIKRRLFKIRQQVGKQRMSLGPIRTRRQVTAVGLSELRTSHRQLANTIVTVRASSCSAGRLNRRQNHGHQDADDRNDYEQLDKRKSVAIFASRSSVDGRKMLMHRICFCARPRTYATLALLPGFELLVRTPTFPGPTQFPDRYP